MLAQQQIIFAAEHREMAGNVARMQRIIQDKENAHHCLPFAKCSSMSQGISQNALPGK
jgi:hypothetical protein